MALTQVQPGMLASDSQYTGFKNRIFNGQMQIDQRNAGAVVTTNGAYVTDRFYVLNATDGTFSSQRSTTAPSNYINSLYFTTTAADASLGATQAAYIAQHIEGLNVADLGWGTATAQTVTLSFKVRSSLTGTFGGSLANSARDRSYPFTYTISSANTWTDISITIAGDQSGTWLTDNGIGIRVLFGLGVGSTLSGTAGAWAGADYRSATGATAVISTLNATFYITGVQLEKGSTATSFDYRPYGTELALCQRYFEHSFGLNTPAQGANSTSVAAGAKQLVFAAGWSGGNGQNTPIYLVVPKRTTPSLQSYGNSSGYLAYLTNGSLPTTQTSFTWNSSLMLTAIDNSTIAINNQAFQSTLFSIYGGWSASAEL